MNAIEARYAGECADCGGWISVGTSIVPHSVIRSATLWKHAICPDDDPLEPTSAVCPHCHLTHQGECF